MVCTVCNSPLSSSDLACAKCGAWNPNTAGTFAGATIKAEELVDACDVDASTVEHIATGGPWDAAFGGGPVPGSTTMLCGHAGGGKSTILLQMAAILARLSSKPCYYISGEQAAGELRWNLDRLQIPPDRGQFVFAKSMNASGLLDDSILSARPPSSIIIDSLNEICGQKNYDAQVALAKAHKEPVAVKYKCPVFFVAQMNKQGDTSGMNALQHGPDTLIEVQNFSEDPRKRARMLREFGLEDGDIRVLFAYKNRFGPCFVEYPMLMGPHGLIAIPRKMIRTRRKTGDPLRDLILKRQWLEEDMLTQKQAIREMREEMLDLDERIIKFAAKPPKPPKPTDAPKASASRSRARKSASPGE